MRIVVLGGAGAMAQVIERDLAQSPDVTEVVVADLQIDRARKVVEQIDNNKFEAAKADVTDGPALRKLIADADAVINATWYKLNVEVMRSCIQAGVHYVDLGGLYHVTLDQLKLDAQAKDAGITCLIGMGSTPGTMNVLAAHAAKRLDTIHALRMRSSGVAVEESEQSGFVPPYSFRTMLDEFSLPVPVLRNGSITEVEAMSGNVPFRLPDPVGEVSGFYTIHSELATLPQSLSGDIQEMDFAVAFDDDLTAVLKSLKELGLASRKAIQHDGHNIVPYAFVASVVDALPKPARSPLDLDIQRCEADGTLDGKPATLIIDAIDHPNKDWDIGGGTVGTGTPPSIAAQWLASGRIQVRGVVPPEVAVDPLPFFQELAPRGIRVYEQLNKDAPKPLFR